METGRRIPLNFIQIFPREEGYDSGPGTALESLNKKIHLPHQQSDNRLYQNVVSGSLSVGQGRESADECGYPREAYVLEP